MKNMKNMKVVGGLAAGLMKTELCVPRELRGVSINVFMFFMLFMVKGSCKLRQ